MINKKNKLFCIWENIDSQQKKVSKQLWPEGEGIIKNNFYFV